MPGMGFYPLPKTLRKEMERLRCRHSFSADIASIDVPGSPKSTLFGVGLLTGGAGRIPQSPSVTAPFRQGGLFILFYPHLPIQHATV